jgi:hypothetical protein
MLAEPEALKMAESITSDEVQQKSVAAMPAPLGEIHHWLYLELSWLHIKWSDFKRLYATSEERIDLFNKVAPVFFNQLQRTMWEDILLHLCRITDPIKTKGHDNLTIRRMPDVIPDLALRGTVVPLVKEAEQKTDFARDWRNRRLAHHDLPALQGHGPAAPLATASRQHVEDALAVISKAMNHIQRHYLKNSVQYEASIEALGGVESLVARLTKGIELEKAERERKLSR